MEENEPRHEQQFVYMQSEPGCGHSKAAQLPLLGWLQDEELAGVAIFLFHNPAVDFLQWEEPTGKTNSRQHTLARKYRDGTLAVSRR